MDFFSILTLIGGLAMFLYGMDVMGDGLKKLAGGKLESILSKLTSNRFKGFLLGLFVTAVIQSSAATTVMLVGFVNSGIMKLGQTIGIIMGANIGTTVTAWLLSLSGISGDSFFVKLFKPTSFTPVLAIIGVVMCMLCKSDKKKNIGAILMGFAVLMFGMEAMSGAMSGAKDSDSFGQILVMFSNPVMGILIGMILTAIIQSSSASVGILQALSLTCAIPYSTAIPIILGQNIGASVTPLISAVSGNTQAKRVAFACLYIKIIGVIVVCGIFYALNAAINFAFMETNVTAISIAIIHTLFNVLSTVILMPFCKGIETLTEKTIKGKSDVKKDVFDTLDERFLTIPGFAVEKCHELVCNMATISKDAIFDAISLLTSFDEQRVKDVLNREDEVDRYEDKVSSYLVKIAGQNNLGERDSKEVTELLHVIGDVERISDHAVNIVEVAREIREKKIIFSDEAKKDIDVMSHAVSHIINLATDALLTGNLEPAKEVEPLEQVIDRLKRKIKTSHIERLKDGDCTVEMGFVLADLLTNYERIADHCSNIAVCLIEMAHGSFDTHEYLNHVKSDGENDFVERYEAYKQKYSL